MPIVLMVCSYGTLPITRNLTSGFDSLIPLAVVFLAGWVIGILFYTTGVIAFNLAAPEDES